MSNLIFDGQAHQVTMVGADGKPLGTWPAYNNVDGHATIRALHDGSYTVQDQTIPHAHPADPNGPYGSRGIIRLNVPGHVGIGVHSGRANAARNPGPPHWTMGCIRTFDDAMRAISKAMKNDALTAVEVTRNDQSSAHAASLRHRKSGTLNGSHMARYFPAAIGIILLPGQPSVAQSLLCPQQKAVAAEDMGDRIKSWNDVSLVYDKYRDCDDGAIAEGNAEAIARILVDQWGTLPALVRAASRRPGLSKFVTNHINRSLDTQDIRRVHELATASCPHGAKALCLRLSQAAVSAEK